MVVVRPARPDELAEAGELTVRAYEQYRESIPERFWEPYADELRDTKERAGRGTVLVAELDGRLVGCASIVPHDHEPAGTAHLRMLAVSPDVRRAGVGKALMDATFAHARASGAHTLVWNTTNFMTPARALYERLGYAPDPDPVELAPAVVLYTFRSPLA
jgi:GNAT superfamily N-acetyltransferase